MSAVLKYRWFVVILLVMLVVLPACAEEDIDQPDDWEIRFMPYFWMPSLDAEGTVDGLKASIDINFGDVVDVLDFTAMGRMEAWKDDWGLIFDGLFMNLGADDEFQGTSGPASFALDVDLRLGMFDFGVGYHLYEQDFGDNDQQKITVEPYAGLRYVYLRQKVNADVNIAGVLVKGTSLGGSEDWVEPFVGGRVRWDLNEKLAFDFRGDVGGFGIGTASDLLWQVVLGTDYKLSKNTSLNAGYRIVDLDYSRGSGANEFGMDLRAEGPFLGMTILY